jgi:hypothetical protein
MLYKQQNIKVADLKWQRAAHHVAYFLRHGSHKLYNFSFLLHTGTNARYRGDGGTIPYTGPNSGQRMAIISAPFCSIFPFKLPSVAGSDYYDHSVKIFAENDSTFFFENGFDVLNGMILLELQLAQSIQI